MEKSGKNPSFLQIFLCYSLFVCLHFLNDSHNTALSQSWIYAHLCKQIVQKIKIYHALSILQALSWRFSYIFCKHTLESIFILSFASTFFLVYFDQHMCREMLVEPFLIFVYTFLALFWLAAWRSSYKRNTLAT